MSEQKKETIICIRCGRILRNSKSIEKGMGAVCLKKYEEELKPMKGQIEIKNASSTAIELANKNIM